LEYFNNEAKLLVEAQGIVEQMLTGIKTVLSFNGSKTELKR